MALYAVQNNKEDYHLFETFKTTFIINKCSFFDKKLQILNKQNLNEFEQRFIINYIAGNGQSFTDKAYQQLANSSLEFKHFFTNYVLLYNFFFSSHDYGHYKVAKAVSSKQNELESYLGKSILKDLIPQHGYANCGTFYNTKKDVELSYIHIFIKKIFEYPELLNDEKALIDFIKHMNVRTQLMHYIGPNVFKAGIKNILLFLFFPSKFEPIVSYTDKEKIVSGFGRINYDKDIDDNLFLIREKYNIKNSFYENEHILKWQNVKKEIVRNKKNSDVLSAKIINHHVSEHNSKLNNTFIVKSNTDLNAEYTQKLISGQNAEEIVYLDLEQKYMSNKKDMGHYIKIITKELSNLYSFEKIQPLMNKPLKEICMFSSYVHTMAPFDILYTNGSSVKYVEVKNCSTKPYKIFMSVNELHFAYDNIEHYELMVVINNQIYSCKDFPIEQLYNEILYINSNSLLFINHFELFIDLE
ncbi:MAG: DUF3883 domain-containing protein [Sulfurospirillaceae bacterium]|nr:DUF3883 domain-containing protein [Sulfurospirillaceae bacterium]